MKKIIMLVMTCMLMVGCDKGACCEDNTVDTNTPTVSDLDDSRIPEEPPTLDGDYPEEHCNLDCSCQ